MSDQARRVYVHNLAFTVSDEALRAHFAAVGPVESALVLRRGGDGKSKGCGLVTFATAQAAQKAIASLTETEIEGRKILVREDRDAELPVPRQRGPREDREERAPRPAGGRAPAPRGAAPTSQRLEAGPPGTTLYVGNLPWSADWKAVKDIFRFTGVTPEFCEVKMGRDGRSRGYAVARFASVGDAAKAMEGCSEVELEGRKLIIRVDEKAGQE